MTALSVALYATVTGAAPPLTEPAPILIQQLSISETQIVFSHGGDLWMIARAGGPASQITSGPEDDTDPSFSPGGLEIAFSRAGANGADVYRMASAGGAPVRLTFHPAPDIVRGWSPDGARILFSSTRGTRWNRRLYTVSSAGGPNVELPVPTAASGAFFPDGKRLIYSPRDPIAPWINSWRGYRGGATAVLMKADFEAGAFAMLSSGRQNDRSPTWAGGTLVIASDRTDGVFNLFALDPDTADARPLTRFSDYSVQAVAGARDGTVAFVRDGRIHLLDVKSGNMRVLRLRLSPDRSETKPRIVPISEWIKSAAIGPKGAMIVVEARGELVAVEPSSRRSSRLTKSPGSHEHSPAISADGMRLAYISDASGDEDLYVRSLDGRGPVRRVRLPKQRAGFRELSWSPDGSRLALSDTRFGFWIVSLATGKVEQMDSGENIAQYKYYPSWSPDGRWLAYQKRGANNNSRIILLEVERAKAHQVTNGSVDATRPVFDVSGRYLYFLTSSNTTLADAFGMYSALVGPIVVREVRALALSATAPSPFTAAPLPVPQKGLATKIDLDGLDRRVWTSRAGQHDYEFLRPLIDGTLLAGVYEWPPTPGGAEPTESLYVIDPRGDGLGRKVAVTVEEIDPSANASAIAWKADGKWKVAEAGDLAHPRALDLEDIRIEIDPAGEWRQIYHQAWLIARGRFYDPHYHGQDIDRLESHYAAYLPGITRRSDLNSLLYAALGHLSVSHLGVAGGDIPPGKPVPMAGLLGVDFSIDGDRYRFSRIHRGDPLASVSDAARSPFDAPDAHVQEGEHLLAVGGQSVTTERDILSYFVGTVGRPIHLTVAPEADGGGARQIAVVPLASDAALRDGEWIDANRRAVEERSGGKVGYIYIPDFQIGGINAFIRDFTAGVGKPAMLIDVRYNPGGWAADFMLDMLRRQPLSYYHFRDAPDLGYPVLSHGGPKALLMNARNGSAAETFAWLFRRAGLGPLIGERTAGWGVGHWFTTALQDGGTVVIPMRAFFNPDGSWDIENQGVAPDVPVGENPLSVLRGEDPQLETGVDQLVKMLREQPRSTPRQPQPPTFTRPSTR